MKIKELITHLSLYDSNMEIGMKNEDDNSIFNGEILTTLVAVDNDKKITYPHYKSGNKSLEFIILEVF